MRLEDRDTDRASYATTICPDCHAAPGQPHGDRCPNDQSDEAIDAQQAREADTPLSLCRSLVPSGQRFATKLDLWRFLEKVAPRERGAIPYAVRHRLYVGHSQLWATGDVTEPHTARVPVAMPMGATPAKKAPWWQESNLVPKLNRVFGAAPTSVTVLPRRDYE